MQFESGPHFNMCVSTFAKLHVPRSKHIISKEILMIHPVSTISESSVIPASIFFDQLNDGIKQLKRLNSHPGDATMIGFLPDQIANLDLVMVRIDRKQKDWIDQNLVDITATETATTSAALLRMGPSVAKARKNLLSAEELLQTLNAETDLKVARERFLTQAGQHVSMRDNRHILALPNSTPLPKKYASKQAYTLTVAVESTDRTASTVRFLLVDEALPDQMFSENDPGVRTMITCADDIADIKLLGLCMANHVNVQVEVAIYINISGSGFSYTANLIRILDPALAMAAVKQAMAEDNPDLF
jgi:hypothetical protein